MGDVPLLTCISTSPQLPNITKTVTGVASGSKVAFELDGQLTDYIDFVNTNITQADLYSKVNDLFSIRCPPSITASDSETVAYFQDFESNCVYDETPITTNAFCGQCSLNGNQLVDRNTKTGKYLCFAYRILNSYVTTVDLAIRTNGDTTRTYWREIPFSPQSDKVWHYTCIDVYSSLLSQSSIDSSVSSIVIRYAWLNNNINNGIFIDTVSVRANLPQGYEDTNKYPIDQSINSSCVFPFHYNGNSYTACTLDNNNIPICADSSNRTYQCNSSSIEGVRRLYPKHQLVYDTLRLTHTSNSSQIIVDFRYSDCAKPTLFVASPSTVNFYFFSIN